MPLDSLLGPCGGRRDVRYAQPFQNPNNSPNHKDVFSIGQLLNIILDTQNLGALSDNCLMRFNSLYDHQLLVIPLVLMLNPIVG